MSEALAYRGALSADVQRAVVAAGAVDGAEAAVRLGERATCGGECLVLQGGDAAGWVSSFFCLAFLAFAGGGFLCLLFLGLLEFDLFAGEPGCFSALGFFLFFGELPLPSFVFPDRLSRLGIGQFRGSLRDFGCVLFVAGASVGAGAWWGDGRGEFAGPVHFPAVAGGVDVEVVGDAWFQSRELQADWMLSVVGGKRAFGVLALCRDFAVCGDLVGRFVTLRIDLRFNESFSVEAGVRGDGSDQGGSC